MKRSKFFVGLAVLLVAAVGAFASVQNQFATVHYISGNDCLDITATKTCFVNPVAGCTELVLGTPTQVYASKTPIQGTDRFECQDILSEIEP